MPLACASLLYFPLLTLRCCSYVGTRNFFSSTFFVICYSPPMTRVALSLLPIAALLLGSCDQTNTAADGYQFKQTGRETLEFPVRFVLYNSLEELAAAHRQALLTATGKPVPADRELQAFSILHASGGCTVHIVDPKKKYTPEWYGHEITHCVYGEFHE